jgi:pilus assembly protein CpaF
VSSVLIQRLSQNEKGKQEKQDEVLRDLENNVRRELIEKHRDLIRQRGHAEARDELRVIIDRLVIQSLAELPSQYKSNREELVQQFLNEYTGYGPLEPLLQRDFVSEVQVNGPGVGKIRYEEKGQRQWAKGIGFRDKEHMYRVIEQIVAPTNRPFDELNPFVDCWLPDGSRVNAAHGKTAIDGPYLSVRRFIYAFSMEELIEKKAITPMAAHVLCGSVAADISVLITGGTGAGKTTFLNALSGEIPKNLSIVSAEDSLELKLQHPDVRRHITAPPTVEGKGQISMQHIVKNSLRQFPDWIVVGEVRGDEAFDLVDAGNTGHAIISTAHANNASDGISRLENLILSARNMPLTAIKQKIVRSFRLIAHAARDKRTGMRYISEIIQIAGMKDDEVEIIPLFRFKASKGALEYTGEPFLFGEEFKERGIAVPPEINTGVSVC